MENNKATVPFSVMALMVPAAEAAAGKNWLPTLMLALVSFLLCTWMSVQEEPKWKWLYPARFAALVFLLAWALNQTHSCWPGDRAALAVPAGLMLLAAYGVWWGSAIRASAVLRYGMYAVLAALAFFSLPQLKAEYLRPKAQLPDMQLAAVLLLPLLARKTGQWLFHPVGVAALVSAIVAGGYSSVYQFSRGVTIGGVGQHMESLAACAITVGNFALLCYLLDGMGKEKKDWRVWTGGLAAYGIYLLGLPIRPEVYVLLMVVLWAIVPLLWTLEQKMKKRGNNA